MCIIVSLFSLLYIAVPTMIELLTKSTGIKSSLSFPLAGSTLCSPSAPGMVIAPAAARESVQPGKGSRREEHIMEGRTMRRGMEERCFFRLRSERFLVKV